jgi:hypothetical protein
MSPRIFGTWIALAAVVATAGSAFAVLGEAGGAVAQASCVTTIPNGRAPGRVGASAVWARHGNGTLGAALRRDGRLVTNALGGYKLRWFAKKGLTGRLSVRYQRIDAPSPLLVARSGTFDGDYFEPPSTMSQMGFSAGCWRITGRVLTVRLTFVVQVVMGED